MFKTLQLGYKLQQEDDLLYLSAICTFTFDNLKSIIHLRHQDELEDIGPDLLELWWVPTNTSIGGHRRVDIDTSSIGRNVADSRSLADLFPGGANHGFIHVVVPNWVVEMWGCVLTFS